MKKKFIIFLILTILTFLCSLMLSGCLEEDIGNTVDRETSGTPETDNDIVEIEFKNLSITNYLVDSTSSDFLVTNGETDYSNDSIVENISEYYYSNNEVWDVFCVGVNRFVYINIFLENPHSYKIQSVFINGVEYTKDAFMENSTPTLITIRKNVGNTEGLNTYTVEKIKCFANSKYTTVDVLSNNSFDVYVSSNDNVEVLRTDLETGAQSFSVYVDITDESGFFQQYGVEMKFVLYKKNHEGAIVVEMKDVALGQFSLEFANLETSKTYYYALVTYSKNANNEVRANLFYTERVILDNVVVFDEVTCGYDNVEYSFDWAHAIEDKTFSSIVLEYVNLGQTTTYSGDTFKITDLYSDYYYCIYAKYFIDGVEKTITYGFRTQKVPKPTVKFSVKEKTKEKIIFDINVTDEASTIKGIEVIFADENGTSRVITATHGELTLDNLKPIENDYSVFYRYVYNLKTLEGDKTFASEIIDLPAGTIGLTFDLVGDEYYLSSCPNNVKEIYLPKTYKGKVVTGIKKNAFAGAVANIVYFTDNVKHLEEEVFYLSWVKIDWGDNPTIETIPERSFSGYKAKKISLPDSVVTIEKSAFYDSYLEKITLGKNVKTIGDSAFLRCRYLESINLPESLKTIGDRAFYSCVALKEIKIPNGVESIGEKAFYACSSLSIVEIGKGLKTISEQVFDRCFALTNIVVDEENTAFCSINGDLYTKDGKELIKYAVAKTDTEFVVNDTITKIWGGAFYGATNLQKITIGESVREIGKMAFCGCSALKEAIFKVTSPWLYMNDSNFFTDEEISDAETAGKYLTRCYDYIWKRY